MSAAVSSLNNFMTSNGNQWRTVVEFSIITCIFRVGTNASIGQYTSTHTHNITVVSGLVLIKLKHMQTPQEVSLL